MRINQIKGVIKELGPYTSAADLRASVVIYDYIEFTDGQMLRKVFVFGGLDGKLSSALADSGAIELHVADSGRKGGLLLAVKTGGKLYASDLSAMDSKFLSGLLVIALIVGGLLLLPFYGVGLILLLGAWHVIRSGGPFMGAGGKYVRSLPNAILL